MTEARHLPGSWRASSSGYCGVATVSNLGEKKASKARWNSFEASKSRGRARSTFASLLPSALAIWGLRGGGGGRRSEDPPLASWTSLDGVLGKSVRALCIRSQLPRRCLVGERQVRERARRQERPSARQTGKVVIPAVPSAVYSPRQFVCGRYIAPAPSVWPDNALPTARNTALLSTQTPSCLPSFPPPLPLREATKAGEIEAGVVSVPACLATNDSHSFQPFRLSSTSLAKHPLSLHLQL